MRPTASSSRPTRRPTRWPVAEADSGNSTRDPAARVLAGLDRLAPEGRLGVAVSGGGDSMALLAFAVDWARRRGREAHAVTVDHALRSGSAGEAAFVAAHCARVGVAHRTLRAGPMPPGNLPAAAREARYGLIAGWARGERIAGVALGHTMDDQAETLLMRLARGAGVEGLSGMAARRDWQGIAWLRPMLGIRRAALRDWLQVRGIPWIDDPTNEEDAYDRVKARRALVALEPLGISVEGLAETVRTLARQRHVLARAAAEIEAAAVRWGAYGEARLALEPLRETERDTALRVFAETLVRAAGRAQRPRFRSVEPALSALIGGKGRALTLGGCLVVPDLEGGSLLVCREPSAAAAPVPLRPPGLVWDGRWRIAMPAGVAEEPGGGSLTIGALGQAGCDCLGRAARAGAWQPPEGWAAAPRPVRETVPAVYAATGGGPGGPGESGALLAVPAAGFLAPGAPTGLAAVEATPLRSRDAVL